MTYRATGGNGDSAECTTDSAGTCTIRVTTATTQGYTAAPVGEPPNWFANPVFGTGAAPLAAGNTGTAYDTVTTPSLGPGGSYTVPAAANAAANNQSRGDRIAFSRDEPAAPTACGLKAALVFDLSYSIISPTNHLRQYRDAGESFADALEGTPSQLAVYTFGTNAPATSAAGTSNNATLAPTSVSTAAGAAEVRDKIGGLTVEGAQYTNWDAGLWQVAQSSQHYDDVIMLTDGDPTRFGRPDAGTPFPVTATTRLIDVENGVFSANTVKSQTGTSLPRTDLLAVGINVPSPGSHANLRAISGPRDYYPTDFADLGETLRRLAREQCNGTITVVKHTVPHGGPVSDARPGGAGWGFTSSTPRQAKETDETSSAVNFDTTGETPTTITEHGRDGYTFLHDETRCRYTDSDEPVSYRTAENGIWVRPDPKRATSPTPRRKDRMPLRSSARRPRRQSRGLRRCR